MEKLEELYKTIMRSDDAKYIVIRLKKTGHLLMYTNNSTIPIQYHDKKIMMLEKMEEKLISIRDSAHDKIMLDNYVSHTRESISESKLDVQFSEKFNFFKLVGDCTS